MRIAALFICILGATAADAQVWDNPWLPSLVPLDGDYHLGNSLTQDTNPESLPPIRQWGIGGGRSIQSYIDNPLSGYTNGSVPWPDAMVSRQWRRVFFQPHYGDEDPVATADNIETILATQVNPTIYIHRGWPRIWQWDTPKVVHTQAYLDSLVLELTTRGWQVIVNDSIAPLETVRQDILNGLAPFDEFSELWRDSTHMHYQYGRFLQHNKLRQTLGQPFDGWETMDPVKRAYLLSVLTDP